MTFEPGRKFVTAFACDGSSGKRATIKPGFLSSLHQQPEVFLTKGRLDDGLDEFRGTLRGRRATQPPLLFVRHQGVRRSQFWHVSNYIKVQFFQIVMTCYGASHNLSFEVFSREL